MRSGRSDLLDGVRVLLKSEIQGGLLSEAINLPKHILGECGNEPHVRWQEVAQTSGGVWNAAISGEVIVRGRKPTLGESSPHGLLSFCFGTPLH